MKFTTYAVYFRNDTWETMDCLGRIDGVIYDTHSIDEVLEKLDEFFALLSKERDEEDDLYLIITNLDELKIEAEFRVELLLHGDYEIFDI